MFSLSEPQKRQIKIGDSSQFVGLHRYFLRRTLRIDSNQRNVWTSRRELRQRLPGLARRVITWTGLLSRTVAAVGYGGQAKCNLVLDALIVREEQR